jgi:RNA polymerase sigma factor (sigma-70 family)
MTQPNVDFRSELAGHAKALRSMAQRLVSRADAEDLTHDAMVSALSQPTRPRRMRSWLRQVLRNEARARRRSDLRRQAREARVDFGADPVSAEALADLAQMANAVQDALVDLDPAYRRVLEARFYDERTAADIARSEGCPAGTVRWRLQEGLRRMRSSLDARFQGREAWHRRMAALAAAPLSWAGPPPGEATMISSSLFTKLALGAVVTSVAAGAVVASTANPTDRASEVSRPRPLMAASTSPTSEPVPSRRSSVPARPPRADVPAAPYPDAPCEPCSEDGVPTFEAIASCQDAHPLGADGRVDIHVTVEGDTVASVEVRGQNDDDEALVSCLRDTLPGSEAVGPEGLDASGEFNIALIDHEREVPADLEAPTPAELADDNTLPTRAEGKAPVRTVVACSDYDCPFCDRARSTLDQVLDEHPDVRVAWMHAPLPTHPGAVAAARAAVAAQAQGKFWEMHALLFDRVDQRSDEDLRALAAEIGLDLAQFDLDFSSDETAAAVEAQRASCTAAGARATPSFFVEDQVLIGAQPIEAFRELLK